MAPFKYRVSAGKPKREARAFQPLHHPRLLDFLKRLDRKAAMEIRRHHKGEPLPGAIVIDLHVRLASIKLAAEAADNGVLDPVRRRVSLCLVLLASKPTLEQHGHELPPAGEVGGMPFGFVLYCGLKF